MLVTLKVRAEPAAEGGANRSPVVSEQDVQGSQRAQLQGSLVLTEEGGEDGNGIRENWPQVDLQWRACDQRQSCQRHDVSGKFRNYFLSASVEEEDVTFHRRQSGDLVLQAF